MSRLSQMVVLLIALPALSASTAVAQSAALSARPAGPAVANPGVVVLAATAPSIEARTALDRLLYQYEVVELPLAHLAQRVRGGQLDLVLGGRLFQLELERNDLRAPGYKEVLMTADGPVEQPPRPVSTFAGVVRGEADSIVRLTSDRGMFTGYVKVGEDFYFVDPLREFVPGAAAAAAVVYREADVRPEASGECGVGHRLIIGGGAGGPDVLPGTAPKNHTLRRLQVATEADGEYYARFGNPGLFTRITGILNDVDGIYRSQINLYISITYQQAWPSSSSDPYTSTNASTTLNQLRSWWNANRGSTTRDTVHMFSGKSFSGSTIGIAWVGVICNSLSYSYGISQDLTSSSQRKHLTAHEIGHNLSALHDNDIGCSGVSCNNFGPIMCSFIQTSGSSTFSSCSKSAINTHTHNNPSCLN